MVEDDLILCFGMMDTIHYSESSKNTPSCGKKRGIGVSNRVDSANQGSKQR
jgi:hypothetical protein